MGKPRMRYWLLAMFALSVCALFAAAPQVSHAQVLIQEGSGADDGAGPEEGDPDQPNLKTRTPQSISTAIVYEPRAGRQLESGGATTAVTEDRSLRAWARRGFDLLYVLLRARWGW